MRRPAIRRMLLALFALATAAPVFAQVDEQVVCIRRVKSVNDILAETLNWIPDEAMFQRLTDELVDYMACEAWAGKPGTNSCKSLEKIEPATTREGKKGQQGGALADRCVSLGTSAAFFREMWTTPKNATQYPACTQYYSQRKIFNVRSKDFEKACCNAISKDMQAGKDFCTGWDLKPYLAGPVPHDQLMVVCHAARDLYTKGDSKGCDILKDEFCREEAELARAVRSKDLNACPQSAVERGICRAFVTDKPKDNCAQMWSLLRNDYCREQARVGKDNLPKKPSKKAKDAGEKGQEDKTDGK